MNDSHSDRWQLLFRSPFSWAQWAAEVALWAAVTGLAVMVMLWLMGNDRDAWALGFAVLFLGAGLGGLALSTRDVLIRETILAEARGDVLRIKHESRRGTRIEEHRLTEFVGFARATELADHVHVASESILLCRPDRTTVTVMTAPGIIRDEWEACRRLADERGLAAIEPQTSRARPHDFVTPFFDELERLQGRPSEDERGRSGSEAGS